MRMWRIPVLILGCGLARAAAAITPIAVFDGDTLKSRTSGNYTLNLNGNSQDEATGHITVDGGAGSTITASDAGSAPFGTACGTVILRFTDFDTPLSGNVQLIANYSGRSSYHGVAAQADGNCQGIWNGGVHAGSAYTGGAFTLSADTVHTVAFAWKRGTTGQGGGDNNHGTRIILDGVQLANWSGLYGNYSPTKIEIGGPETASATIGTANGMRIMAVAVFTSMLTQQEVAAYRFPTEVADHPKSPARSYSVKCGARADREAYIVSDDSIVGAYPVDGAFWNNTRLWAQNNASYVDVQILCDGTGSVADGVKFAYAANNTYYPGEKIQYGNGKLTNAYFDDGANGSTTVNGYSAAMTSATFAAKPDGVTTSWRAQLSNFPNDLPYTLYVYVATDQGSAPPSTYDFPVLAVKTDVGEWTYYKGEDGRTVTTTSTTDTWAGQRSCNTDTLVEGTNYLKVAIPAGATTIDLTSVKNARFGLAALQLVASNTISRTESVVFVSELNAALSGAAEAAVNLGAESTRVVFDEAPAALYRFCGAGALVLAGRNGAPRESELHHVSVAGMTGAVSYGPAANVVSYNFAKDKTNASMTDQSGNDGSLAGGSIPKNSWTDLTGNSGTDAANASVWDGSQKIAWTGVRLKYSANGTYAPGASGRNSEARFMNGYLDDGSGKQTSLSVTNIPFSNYDAIVYYQGDNVSHRFKPLVVNGKTYSGYGYETDDGDMTPWGRAGQPTLKYAQNAVRIDGLSGDLSVSPGIYETVDGYLCRGTIAALQILSAPRTTGFVTAGAPTWANEGVAFLAETAFGANDAYMQTVGGREAQVVSVTGALADNAYVFGGAAQTGGPIAKDIWMEVSGGTYMAIVGGSNSEKWGSGTALSITGNIVLEVGGDTVANHVLGGNHKDGRAPTIDGNVTVVIRDGAVVRGAIVGSGICTHSKLATVTGNTKVIVRNVQSDNSASTLVGVDYSDYVVGAGAYATNTGSSEKVNGDSSVEVDIDATASGTFVKHVVGGGLYLSGSYANGHSTVDGNSSVTVNAPSSVTFTGNLVAGGYKTAGDAMVYGNATLTINGGTVSSPNVTGGEAKGVKTLAVNCDLALDTSVTTVSGFDVLAIAGGKALTLTVPADASFALPTNSTGSIVKTGVGSLTLDQNVTTNVAATFTVNEGALRFVLTPEQIESTVPFPIFKSSQPAASLTDRVLAVSANGETVPGDVSKDGATVLFKPSVDFFTRTVASGGAFDWADGGWTKNGVAGQTYAVTPGRIADVTVTLSGDATVSLTAAPESMEALKFNLAAGAAAGKVTVSYTPAELPDNCETGRTYQVLGVEPTAAEGVTVSYSLNASAATYAWQFLESSRTFVATRRPTAGAVNIRIGARDSTFGYIQPTFNSVGANPFSGVLWTHAKLYNNNSQQDPGYTDLGWVTDSDGSGRKLRYALRAPNTYYNTHKGNPADTPNEILTSSYADDGDTAASRTWTVTNAQDKTDFATLPAAPNARGWQIHLDNIPYSAYDVYFITAVDKSLTDDCPESPIKLSANGGTTWVSYTADSSTHGTTLGTDNWTGLPFATGKLREGYNYLKMRVSPAILGTESVATLEITHGLRGNGVRSGLAGIQVVELMNDGTYTLEKDGGWTKETVWSSMGALTDWQNDGEAYAIIPSTGKVSQVTVDADVFAKKVTVSGTKDFRITGASTLISGMGVDLSEYSGILSVTAPVSGTISIGAGAQVGFEVADGAVDTIPYAYAFAGSGFVTKLGDGTLYLDSTYQPQVAIKVAKGKLRYIDVAPAQPVTIESGATLEIYVGLDSSVTCSTAFSGEGKFLKTGPGTLTLNGMSGFTGGSEIREGKVVFGGMNGSGLGPLGAYYNNSTEWTKNVITVGTNAVLDVNGNYDMTYVVELQGGATLRNGGADIGSGKRQIKKIRLLGDANVESVGVFGLHNGGNGVTCLDLNGHTLTKRGDASFELVNTKIYGGGVFDVREGAAWPHLVGCSYDDNQATIRIRGSGSLVLDSALTIQNLTVENGGVSGSSSLTVFGALDVSEVETTIGTLTVRDASSLVGDKLAVSGAVTFGTSLNLVLPSVTGATRVAKVPASTAVPTTVSVNGDSGYEMYVEDAVLMVKPKGIVTGYIHFDSTNFVGGVNFTSAVVAGTVRNLLGADDRAVWVNIVFTSGDGTSFTGRVIYTGGKNGKFSYDVSGLDLAQYYSIDAYLTVDGVEGEKVQVESSDPANLRTAETGDAEWIREDAETYAGLKDGTGSWDSDAPVRVDGSDIVVSAVETREGLAFTPASSPTIHNGCEYRTTIAFGEAAEAIDADERAAFGVTVYRNDADELQLVLVGQDGWHALPRTVFAPELDVAYEFTFVVHEDEGTVGCLVRGASNESIHLGELAFTGSEVVGRVDYLGSGAVRKLEADGYDTRLVTVDVDFDEDTLAPSTNFAALASSGTITVNLKHATDRTSGKIRVCLRDSSGVAVLTNEYDFAQLGKATKVEIRADGLVQGGTYAITTEIVDEGGTGENVAGENEPTPMVRLVGDWVYEDADTFLGLEDSDGEWSGTNGTATAYGEDEARRIYFTNLNWNATAAFAPCYTNPSVAVAQQRELRFTASFDRPGFFLSDGVPSVITPMIGAITLAADDLLACSVAVCVNNAWQVVPRTVFRPELGVVYEFVMTFDLVDHALTYAVVQDDTEVELISVALPDSADRVQLSFCGRGSVRQLAGTCQDANLMSVGDEEYWTFEDARAAAGTTGVIKPLWLSSYDIVDARGEFRIFDPTGLLTLHFQPWYTVVVTQDGDIRIYRYNASNNWIDYADVSGVTPIGDDGWIVTSAEGLAWIAAEATNKWVHGTVELAADIDLALCNWTPIAQFTGTFDGHGHCISGLNNTNVIRMLGQRGTYPSGPTNDWGRSAYGLFATTTNATLRNVILAEVAISNCAESVAALLGTHAGGDLGVSNVTVGGYVLSTAEKAAGIIGSMAHWQNATIAQNVNSSVVDVIDSPAGDPRWTAGILTVEGTAAGDVGPLVISCNTNLGVVCNTVYNNENGGNVAQIVAGTSWETRFGDVAATNNVAAGAVEAEMVGMEGWALGADRWSTASFPICNFAAAVTHCTAEGLFRRYVEANAYGSVPIDPVYRTARMLSGYYQNGAPNDAGALTDLITSAADGKTVSLPAGAALDVWDTVVVDRSVTIDLNGGTLNGVYDCDLFWVADGMDLTVENGTVKYVEGFQTFTGGGTHQLVNVSESEVSGDFYSRTVPPEITKLPTAVRLVVPHSSPYYYYCVDTTPSLAQDWEYTGCYGEGTGGAIVIEVPADAPTGFYRVRLSDYIDE